MLLVIPYVAAQFSSPLTGVWQNQYTRFFSCTVKLHVLDCLLKTSYTTCFLDGIMIDSFF